MNGRTWQAIAQAGPEAAEHVAHLVTETARTMAGHWHPDTVECTERCPMGDPRTRDLFRATLDRAATLGTRRGLPGYALA
jgi:hypothetical protein